jgi:hypothetical protein
MARTIIFGVDLVGKFLVSKPRILELQPALRASAKMKSLVIHGKLDRRAITQRTIDILGWYQLAARHGRIFSEISFRHL